MCDNLNSPHYWELAEYAVLWMAVRDENSGLDMESYEAGRDRQGAGSQADTGITGLAAAWALAQRHQVVVYEQEPRPGGHSHTVDTPSANAGPDLPVDTGFIVCNPETYPNLLALFDHLGVATVPTEMSFAVSIADGALGF